MSNKETKQETKRSFQEERSINIFNDTFVEQVCGLAAQAIYTKYLAPVAGEITEEIKAYLYGKKIDGRIDIAAVSLADVEKIAYDKLITSLKPLFENK